MKKTCINGTKRKTMRELYLVHNVRKRPIGILQGTQNQSVLFVVDVQSVCRPRRGVVVHSHLQTSGSVEPLCDFLSCNTRNSLYTGIPP